MDILFIVPYFPNLVRVRPYNLIRSLTARGHRVTVMTLSNHEEERIRNLDGQYHRVFTYDLPTWRSYVNAMIALPTTRPLQASYCWQPDLANASLKWLHNGNGNPSTHVIHIEHLRGARYGLHIIQHLTSQNHHVPVIWDSVDSITHLFEQAAVHSQHRLSRWLTRFELNRTRRYERFLLQQFNHVLVTSQVDKDAFLSLAPVEKQPPNISVLPNGVDLAYFTPLEDFPREEATLVVSGKMSYHANVTMVLHLVKEIMPIVWARKPEVKLWIVGKDPTGEIKDLEKNHNLTITGTVDDLRPYLQTATLVVAPLQYGAGIQNKVLEAMACGTPVIGSSQAISALAAQPGQDCLVADQPNDFAERVLELLDDQDEQRRIGEAGRRYVEMHHNWDHIAAKLEEIYFAICDRKPSDISK